MLADEIDRYLLSLMTLRSPATISWYRKRLDPLRSIYENISSISLSDLQQTYAGLANQTTYQFYGRWDAAELHALHDRYTWLPADVPEETAPTAGVDAVAATVLK